MKVNKNLRDLLLPGGLALATLGMAAVTIGVVVTPLFFAGIYLLAIGLVIGATGVLLRL